MASAPALSVVLPTNGAPLTIGPSIASILAQTFTDFELLVVGDGACDATAAQVQSFDDRRLRWMPNEKGPGKGAVHRNAALRAARARVVVFAQHDDLMLPDHLHRMADLFARRSAIRWAYSRPLWVDDVGHLLPFYVNLKLPRHLQNFLENHCVIPSSFIAVERETALTVGGFDETVVKGPDWMLWRRMIELSGPAAVGFLRVPTVLHFRAGWKTEGLNWGPPPIGHLGGIARSGPLWPVQLTVPIPDGAVPQVAVAEHLATHGQGAISRIRAGVEMLQDAFAWTASHSPLDQAAM